MPSTAIIHKAEGTLAYFDFRQVPCKGDWIELDNNTYEIKQVIWLVSTGHVRLIVDDLKD